MSKSPFLVASIIALSGCLWGQTVSFTQATGSPYPSGGTAPSSVAVSDFNKDGVPDVVVSNSGTQYVNSSTANYTVWLGVLNGSGQPSGALGTAHPLPFLASDQTAADRAVNVAVQKSVPSLLGSYYSALAGGSNTNHLRNATVWNSSFSTGIGSVSMLNTTYTRWAATGDLDADGIDDAAVTLTDSVTHNPIGTVAVYPGTAFGSNIYLTTIRSFTVILPAGLTAYSVALGDLNGDGKADMVVATGGTSVVVYLSTSDNVAKTYSFGAANTISGLPANAQYITIADVTGDGKPDLVITTGGGGVMILPGAGNGTFGAATSVAVAGSALSVATGDFTHDGIADLAVANGANILILPGTGGGAFGAAITVPSGGANPVFVTAADMDGNGKLDLVVANGTDATVSVLLNTTPVVLAGPSSLSFNAALNGANPPSQTVSVNFDTGGSPTYTTSVSMVGGGSWLSANSAGSGPLTVSANIAGLATGTYTGTITINPTGANRTTVSVSMRVAGPSGTLVKQSMTLSGVVVSTADLNGDGKADILLFRYTSATCSNYQSELAFYAGDGSGGFAAPVSSCSSGPYNGQFFAMADFNGDGKADLALASSDTACQLRWYLGDGAGHFTMAPETYSLGTNCTGIVAADFNSDGKMDLAASTSGPSGSPGTAAVLMNDGTGNFTLQSFNQGTTSGGLVGLAAGDFDRDGRMDLVVADRGDNAILFLRGQGNGYFAAATQITGCSGPYTVTAADFNNDGKLDFAAGCVATYTYSVYLGNGNGTFTKTAAGSPTTTLAIDFLNGDFDGDGNLDLLYLGSGQRSFTVAHGDGAGGFDLPGTVFDNGIYISTPASFLTADFNGDGRLDVIFPYSSPYLYFGASAPTTAAVSSSPLNQAPLGQSVAYSAAVTPTVPSWATPSGQVTITDNPDGQLAQGLPTGGVYTASKALTLGSHTVNATYAGDARTLAGSSPTGYPFTVVQAHLAFATQPVSTTAGATMANIVVKVQDNSNATVTGFTSAVTLALSSNAFAAGSTATVNAVAGVATFNNIKINATGTNYTLTASATGLPNIVSNPFNITAGALAKFTVAGFPNPATANLAGNFTVTAQDAGGNTITGYAGTVHFTSSDASAVLPADYTFVAGDNGVHGFSGTLKTVGTQSITATDTVSAPVTGSQTGIVVQVGAASTLTPTGTPQSAVVNTAYGTMSVTLTDTGGNPVPNQTITFTAPASGPSGAFAGPVATATAVTNASGVATVPAFTANTTAGAFTLTASLGTVSTAFSLTNLPGSVVTFVTVQAGDNQSTALSTAFPTALSVLVGDAYHNPMPGVTVTFTLPGSGASAGFPGAALVATAVTNASGIASAPAATANGTAGKFSATASAGGVTATFSNLNNLIGAPAHLTLTAGGSQSAVVGTAFATQLVANVTDAGNNPIQNVTVAFTAPASGPSGTFPGSLLTVNATTDAAGNATAPVFTANTAAGVYTMAVAAASLTATASLTNTAGPATLTINAGNNQSAAVSTAFTTPLSVRVADSYGNPYSGTSIAFTAPASGASGTFANATVTTSASTNASGIASATALTANGQLGAYSVSAAASGLTAVNFSLSNVAGPPANLVTVAGTPQSTVVSTAFAAALSVKVMDAGNNPLSGVTVTFAPAPGNNGASGAFSGSASVTTNTSGIATAPTFTANTVAGAYLVTATVNRLSGNFNLTNLPGSAAIITPTGTPQSAFFNAAFNPLSVKITDASGNPIAGLSVSFTAGATAGATGTFPGNAAGASATTDANGNAAAPVFTANGTAGVYTVTATSGSLSASFALTNLSNPPAAILVVSGAPQNTVAGSSFPVPLTARVVSGSGSPLSNISVTFTLPANGPSGTFSGGGLSFTAVTNSQGLVVTPGVIANQTPGSFSAVASTGSLQAVFALSIGGPPPVTVDPDGFLFRYEMGLPVPGQQTAVVSNAGSSFTTTSSASWAKSTPMSTGGLPWGVGVSVDVTGLAPGTYYATVVITPNNGALSASAKVTLIVVPKPVLYSAPTSLIFTYVQGQAVPPEQKVNTAALSRNIAFTLSTQLNGAAKSNWLNAVATNNVTTTPAVLRVSVAPVGLDVGTYQGVVRMTGPDATNSPYDIPVTLNVIPAPPAIASIVNAASFQNNAVTGNEILAMFGTNLNCAGGGQVLVDGVPALVLGGTPTQVNWVAPDLGGRASIQVQFACGSNVSNVYTMSVTGVVPGIFTSDGSQVAAYNTGYTLNGPAIPIARGSVIMLFGTGFGALSAADDAGLQRQTVPVTVTVGGAPATLTFAGAAPGLPGVNQVNVLIPAGASTGAAVPLVVTSGSTAVPTGLTVAIN